MMMRSQSLVLSVALLACGSRAHGQITIVSGPPADLGEYKALMIGIDGYEHWPKLQYAEQDAHDLSEILIQQYGFKRENVRLLLGGDATKDAIDDAITDALISAADKRDNLLVYYAGHGSLDAFGSGYWIPVDGDLKRDSTWIPFSKVRDRIQSDSARPKSILLLSDSCYSGDLTRSGDTPGKPDPDDQQYLQHMLAKAQYRSRMIVASGGYETVPDKSIFAGALRVALTGNSRMLIDFESLYNDMRSMILQKTRQEPRKARLGASDEWGHFVLVRAGADLTQLAGTAPVASGEPSRGATAPVPVARTPVAIPADVVSDALALAKQGKCEEALPKLEQAALVRPDNAAVAFSLGECALALEDCPYAVDGFSQAIQLNPRKPEYFEKRADAMVCAGRHSLAIRDLDAALALTPTGPLFKKKGDLHTQLGELQDAILAYRRATEMNPADAAAFELLGKALHDNGDQALGQRMLDKAAALRAQ